jgi:hypothetical protein
MSNTVKQYDRRKMHRFTDRKEWLDAAIDLGYKFLDEEQGAADHTAVIADPENKKRGGPLMRVMGQFWKQSPGEGVKANTGWLYFKKKPKA